MAGDGDGSASQTQATTVPVDGVAGETGRVQPDMMPGGGAGHVAPESPPALSYPSPSGPQADLSDDRTSEDYLSSSDDSISLGATEAALPVLSVPAHLASQGSVSRAADLDAASVGGNLVFDTASRSTFDLTRAAVEIPPVGQPRSAQRMSMASTQPRAAAPEDLDNDNTMELTEALRAQMAELKRLS